MTFLQLGKQFPCLQGYEPCEFIFAKTFKNQNLIKYRERRKPSISTENVINKMGDFTFIVVRNLDSAMDIVGLAKVHFLSHPTEMNFLYEFQRHMTLGEGLRLLKAEALASCSKDVIEVFDWALNESNLGYVMAVEKLPY